MENMYNTFVSSDGTAIHYVDFGKGKPLLFVHGFGGSSELQLPILNMLKANFRCICFDQRGYGKTSDNGEIGLHQSARDTKELLEHLQIHDAVFLGYSMGAGVLFAYVEQFGCQYLERVIIGEMTPKLVNDDTWHYGLYQGWYTQTQFEKDLQTMKDDYASFNTYFAVQTFFQHTPDEVRDFDAGKVNINVVLDKAGAGRPTLEALLSVSPEQESSNSLYWESMGKNDFRDILKKISIPAAIFYADPGSIYDPRAATFMSKNIPDATLYRFENCTHMAKNERLDQFIYSIKAFSQQL